MDNISTRKESQEQLQSSYGQLRALARHLEAIREGERMRIARQVHDELGMAMTCLKMDLSRLDKLVSTENVAIFTVLSERIHSMIQLVDNTIQVVQRVASDLRPGVLDKLGLVAALEWQAQEFQARTGIVCTVKSEAADCHLGQECETALFRICQEALSNVARHAQATRAGIRVSIAQDDLHVIVEDNGMGISDDKVSALHSLGVMGMRERAVLLGGTFCIAGIPGQGTTIVVKMPLTKRPWRTRT